MTQTVIAAKAHRLLTDENARADLIYYQQNGRLPAYLQEIQSYLSGVLWFEYGGCFQEESVFNLIRERLTESAHRFRGLSRDDTLTMIEEEIGWLSSL